MQKFILTAVAAASLAASSANADPADAYDIYLSGASVVKTFVNHLVTTNTQPLTNRLFITPATVVTGTGALNDQETYTFNASITNPALTPYVGPASATKKPKIIIHRRGKGGATYGLFEVIQDPLAASKIDFLTTIGTAISHTPDYGIVGLDGSYYTGDNFPVPAHGGFTTAPTAAQLATLTKTPGPTVVTGIVVDNVFFNALKAKQGGVARPSLSHTTVANLLKGVYSGADLPALPAGKQLSFVSRSQGSGLRAQIGKTFLNYPTSGVHQINASTATVNFVQAGDTQGAVDTQLAAQNAAGNWAFGYAGTDSIPNTTTKPYQFVRIDGVEPTVTNAAAGTYKSRYPQNYFVKATPAHIFDTVAAYNTAKRAIVNELIRETRQPAVIASLNLSAVQSWGQGGYTATNLQPLYYGP